MRPNELAMRPAPVVAAGVGVRRRSGWALRAASFRVGPTPDGQLAMGIATAQSSAGSAVVDLLAGIIRPTHGELRVLGQDLTTAGGRASVRRLVGVARPACHRHPGQRVRGVITHAARVAGMPERVRDPLAAVILDRLGLTAWASVPVWSTPRAVRRRAALAAAAVHEPALLLLDGLFDGLTGPEAVSLAGYVRDLARDTAIIATGCNVTVLGPICQQVLTLADGILVAN